MEHLFDDPRFSIVPETMVDGLIVIDAAGLIRYFNHACETLFQYKPEEAIGRNVSILMPEPFAGAHDGFLQRHRETQVKRIIGIGRELTGKRKDGSEFPMYLSVGEGAINGETLFTGIIYDLTEKRRSEALLLHHQKLDAIGQLSGGVAHDFNNLINIITGNLEMAADAALPPGAQRAVERAQEAAWRAARITQRLLAFARRQPMRPRQIDLNRALDALKDMLQRALGEGVSLALRLSPEPAFAEVDTDQFETAILNLAINARDAMPNGGQVTIETSFLRLDAPSDDPDAPEGEFIRVAVSDDGDGMAPEILARAMEPFFTTKGAGAGTGLGLSMVYGFMGQIGGHARISSKAGAGTRVSLYFPRADGEASAPGASTAAAAPQGAGEIVLVVEDDADVAHVTIARLEGLGYQVLSAVDGPSAMRLIESARPIDLVFSDVVMPGGLSGHDIAEAVKRVRPDTAVVLTSGYSAEMAAGARAERVGAHFLPKPYSRAALARVIRAALDERAKL